MTTTKKEKLRKLVRRIRTEFSWYAERFLKIQTKDARVAPLKLKSVQRKIDAVWEQCRKEGKPLRLYILKARREGASTHTDARMFHRASTHKNRRAFIVTHDDKTSVELFDMVKLFLDNLPEQLRPMQRYSSRRELVFENPDDKERAKRPGLRSRLSVGSARNVDVGKGTLVHDLHCSEFAFYRNPKAFLDSILPTVPDLPESAIVLETTPDASGSFANQLWNDSKEGKTIWYPLFLAWYDDDEYRIPFASKSETLAFVDSLSEDEKSTQKAYGLSLEQLHWRRKELRKYSNPQDFLNQYPENDVDCWLSSGRNVFPVEKVKAQQANVREPKWIGRLSEDEKGAISFLPDPEGPLRIWRLPKPEERIAIGADVAEGLAHGDFSCAQIVSMSDLDQLAEWHGHTDPDLFGEELYRLAWYFTQGVVGVEANNHGLTTLTTLKKRYGKLYRMNLPSPTNPSETVTKLGWHTNSKTKSWMEDYLTTLLREESATIRSKALIGEILSYVTHDNGSTGATDSCYDDRVLAYMIALQVAKRHRVADPKRRALGKAKRRQLLSKFNTPTNA